MINIVVTSIILSLPVMIVLDKGRLQLSTLLLAIIFVPIADVPPEISHVTV